MARDDGGREVVTVNVGGRAYVSVAVAAERLKVSASHVRRLVRGGRLAAARLSGRWVVQLEAIRQYERDRGPWPPFGVYGGRAEAENQGLLPRKEVA